MKRLVAMSDSHGMTANLRDAAGIAMGGGLIDTFVFLGDGAQDFEKVKPALLRHNPRMQVVAVRGNNDFSKSLPIAQVFTFAGRKALAAHGTAYQVKYGLERLYYAAREMEAAIALYGHTHASRLEAVRGVLLVNPGAVCGGSLNKSAYAELLADEGTFRANLVGWSWVPL